MKVCFVCLHAYSLFNPTKIIHIFGGAEIRCWTFAKALSKKPETQVSFIVLDHMQDGIERYDNVQVYPHSHYRDSQNWLEQTRQEVKSTLNRIKKYSLFSTSQEGKFGFEKLLSPIFIFKLVCVAFNHLCYIVLRWLQRIGNLTLYPYLLPVDKTRIYKDVGADIYCSFGVNELSSEIAAYCKRYKKKFVLFASSDHDFSDKYYLGSHEINQYASVGYLCNYAIMHADVIITQTITQTNLLHQRFKKSSVVISNPIDVTCTDEWIPYTKRRGALWVGKSDQVKRPDILINLAKLFPDYPFKMVMNLVNPDINTAYHDDLLHNKPANVEILDYVPIIEMDSLFREASVFINSSKFEGFPNTFLQAGKHGVPILSLQIDPDNFIEKNQCGLVAGGSFEQLVEDMSTLISDQKKALHFSNQIYKYIRIHHDLNDKVKQLTKLLTE